MLAEIARWGRLLSVTHSTRATIFDLSTYASRFSPFRRSARLGPGPKKKGVHVKRFYFPVRTDPLHTRRNPEVGSGGKAERTREAVILCSLFRKKNERVEIEGITPSKTRPTRTIQIVEARVLRGRLVGLQQHRIDFRHKKYFLKINPRRGSLEDVNIIVSRIPAEAWACFFLLRTTKHAQNLGPSSERQRTSQHLHLARELASGSLFVCRRRTRSRAASRSTFLMWTRREASHAPLSPN